MGGRLRPGCRARDALADARRRGDGRYHAVHRPLAADAVARDYADRFAGVPATSRAVPEDVAAYYKVGSSVHPVVLGLYGDPDRVRGWLPGLPAVSAFVTAAGVLDRVTAPRRTGRAPCHQLPVESGLAGLPVLTATPRDAGGFVTLGVVCAGGPDDPAGMALSVHRMLVLDDRRLTLSMAPGRQLGAAYREALARGERLPVTVNIGAAPAAVVASALSSRFLPVGVGKLHVAGALAGEAIAVAPALTQPTWALAESEIVVEGHLDGTVADEGSGAAVSMPEFLGYDGDARTGLPVVTVTSVTARPSAFYQAVIGPGREQSVILGLAGALSIALSGADESRLVQDVHFSPAGGGMLLLHVSVRKNSTDCDRRLPALARRVFGMHPFVKVIVATDEDVDIRCAEDVWWAVSTRANLATDLTVLRGYPSIPMDPSQRPAWIAGRGGDALGGDRALIDATVPFRLRARTSRSFATT
jgi:4-hydroxy-3-polyprenylbenzoate decarboxylase